MISLLDQIRVAKKVRGWSVQKLIDESGLQITRSCLQRKLFGRTKGGKPVSTTSEEIEALARALGITVAFASEAKAS